MQRLFRSVNNLCTGSEDFGSRIIIFLNTFVDYILFFVFLFFLNSVYMFLKMLLVFRYL